MKNIQELIQIYKEYLTILNRAEGTIRKQISGIKFFLTFIESYHINDIQDITHEHLLEYQKYCHYRQNKYNHHDSISVQNSYLSHLKSFFTWLKKEGYTAYNPAGELQYAKKPKLLPLPSLTNKEMKQLLRQPDTGAIEGYRNRTIFEILYSTGMRKSELLNLKIQDIDYEQGYIRINQGKGQKDRVVPLGKIASKYTETYIKGVRLLFKNSNQKEDLFMTRRGNRMAESTLNDMIKRYAKQSKIDKHISCHTFRRSCATEMIKNRSNLMHIKELLGHNSMETVQSYCNLTIVDLKEAHKKYHPREKDVK